MLWYRVVKEWCCLGSIGGVFPWCVLLYFAGGTQLKSTGVKSEEVKLKAEAVETASAASVDDGGSLGGVHV